MIIGIILRLCVAASVASGFAGQTGCISRYRTNNPRFRNGGGVVPNNNMSSASEEDAKSTSVVTSSSSSSLHPSAPVRAPEPRIADPKRRALLRTAIALPSSLPLLWTTTTLLSLSFPNPSDAATPKIRPDDAYANLKKARAELQYAGETFLPAKDWEGLRAYLADGAVNMNAYDANAGALLESKRLDAESKRDIGTIRRYGVGADVIIMYGGLKGEVAVGEEEENNESGPSAGEVGKYLKRTKDALDEVLAICRSNGFD